MDIKLKKLEEYKLEDFELIAKWYNDPDIKPYISVSKDEKEADEESGEILFNRASSGKNKSIYFIMEADRPVGVVSIIDKFEGLTLKDDKTAWISICIGEKQLWGRRIGKKAMELLEDRCKEMGYESIELGVFDFNARAIELYKNLGYKEININHDFTYHNGKWHDDIRMNKIL